MGGRRGGGGHTRRRRARRVQDGTRVSSAGAWDDDELGRHEGGGGRTGRRRARRAWRRGQAHGTTASSADAGGASPSRRPRSSSRPRSRPRAAQARLFAGSSHDGPIPLAGKVQTLMWFCFARIEWLGSWIWWRAAGFGELREEEERSWRKTRWKTNRNEPVCV